ncbi:MAG: hypothetical protein H7A41_00660 [Chlamydiales bacterium]|nr:hypothetical protein [Chlamydiales bacterium]
MESSQQTPLWNKNSPQLWAKVFEYLGKPHAAISTATQRATLLFYERVYFEIIQFYKDDGGELYVIRHFSSYPGQSTPKKLERIMEKVLSSPINRYQGIGWMGRRIFPIYEEGLKVERLEIWKGLKGGYHHIARHTPELLLPGLEFGRAFRTWRSNQNTLKLPSTPPKPKHSRARSLSPCHRVPSSEQPQASRFQRVTFREVEEECS